MIQKYPDFWHVLIGNGSLGSFAGYLVIAYICAAVSVLIETQSRDLASVSTPVKFSWSFLLAANLKRFIANFLLIPITIRLIYQYIPGEWMILASIGTGAGVDRLAMWFKTLGLLTTNKLAERVKQKLAPDDHVIVEKP